MKSIFVAVVELCPTMEGLTLLTPLVDAPWAFLALLMNVNEAPTSLLPTATSVPRADPKTDLSELAPAAFLQDSRR